jgi:hypothetical protein
MLSVTIALPTVEVYLGILFYIQYLFLKTKPQP